VSYPVETEEPVQQHQPQQQQQPQTPGSNHDWNKGGGSGYQDPWQ
jgi:hypothetical protein